MFYSRIMVRELRILKLKKFSIDHIHLSDTNKNYESSGLGLAISKNLANGMNSDILVKSIPHKQTVFNWKIKK